MPILHRPTFEAAVFAGHHIRDNRFACVVLLVCAMAARFVHDPRVLLEGSHSTHSAGWKWFCQVQPVLEVIHLETTRLYDLQIAYVSSNDPIYIYLSPDSWAPAILHVSDSHFLCTISLVCDGSWHPASPVTRCTSTQVL